MNIRKPADYSNLFSELDKLMTAQFPQMELYCEIGRVVSGRSEKGAAVAASEYLQAAYLSHSRGLFSPQCAPYAGVLRSLRENA